MSETVLLEINHLTVSFPGAESGSEIQVVRNVDFSLSHSKTLGLVGESGSGKSMSALSLLGLVPWPGKTNGSIRYKGRELVGLDETSYEDVRGAQISMVFQDPATSLNPVFTIEQQLVETLKKHNKISPSEAIERAITSLREVDIPSPEKRLKNYPHQLSGGMKQRIMIAMALLCEPQCLILDEPTTALDVTVQSQILDLIELIQSVKKTSILLISHDLSIISEISDNIAVMYAGRIVEVGPTPDMLRQPRHPYTVGLMNSIPKTSIHKSRLSTIPGFPPNPLSLPPGCPFHPRCPRSKPQCQEQDPALTTWNQQAFACWNPVPAYG